MSTSRYTVVLRGEHRFFLTKAQMQHDSPNNFFACCFLNDFKESESRTVELDQDPALFAIIVQHMSGYRVLPLAPSALPHGMTHEVAMENLARDAQFLGLEGLYRLLTVPMLPPHILGDRNEAFTGPLVDFEDVINGRLPVGVGYGSHGLCADGSQGNVLVYGKNMRLDFDWAWYNDMPDIEEVTDGFSYGVYLGLGPTQLQTLKQQHKGWVTPPSYNTSDPDTRLVAELPPRWARDGSIHIDGHKALLKHFPLWMHNLLHSPAERTQQPCYEDIRVFDEAFPGTVLPVGLEHENPGDTLHLWIDEAFFVIYGYHGGPDGTPLWRLRLLEVKARTHGAIMGASFPPLGPERHLR